MKYFYKIIFAIALFTITSFTFSSNKSSFDFKIKKIENNIVKARFQLTNSIDVEKVKEKLLSVDETLFFIELNNSDRYYQIQYVKQTSLDRIREVFLSFSVDFDKKFIIITDKSFYKN